MTSPVLYIIRGVPGSGKSTVAKEINEIVGTKHFEADMFFVSADGTYKFEPWKIKKAHEWCRDMVHEEMKNSKSVVVSNTFTQFWELELYFSLAVVFGYDVLMITCSGEWENEHGVPKDKVQAMKDRFQSGEYIVAEALKQYPNLAIQHEQH